jgi:hypothetical protein
MKFTEEIKQEFMDNFKGYDFERGEVEEMLAPYFNFDPERAYREALAREAQRLITCFRDKRNVRDCFSYDANGQSRFNWPEATTDIQVLEKMEKKLQKQMRGLEKSTAKVQARIWILKKQLTIFDAIQMNEMREQMGR